MQEDSLVFIVDDDASICQSLTWLIESVGIKVETFPSAAEFLKRHPHDGPACLVLDVRMPGLSGFDLQNQLAAAGRVIPIIFITGHGNVSMSVRAMKAGAVDFIEKPFEDQTLLDALNQSLAVDFESQNLSIIRSTRSGNLPLSTVATGIRRSHMHVTPPFGPVLL